MTRAQNSVQLAAESAAVERELLAARRLIAAFERILIGCREKSFDECENGNGVNVGVAIERARKAYKKATMP